MHPLGLWYILGVSMALTLGSLLVPKNLLPDSEKYNSIESVKLFFFNRSNFILILIVLFCLITIVGIIILLLFGIKRYELNINIFSLISLPSQFYDDRDAGILLIPWYIRYLTYFIMPSSLLSGIVIPFEKYPRKIICYVPIILAIIIGMVYTTRATILFAMVLFLSGLFSSYIILKKDDRIFSGIKPLFSSALLLLFLLLSWVLLQWLRGGGDSEFIFYPIINTIKSAVLGSTTAFTTWLQNYKQHHMAFGIYTFAGPMDIIGLNERQLGFYSEFISLPNGYSNIYTAFRGLIHDFTLTGSILICFFIGIFAQLSYQRCRDGNVIWLIPLSLFFAFTLFSPFISIFSSNSVTMAWVISFFMLINKKQNSIDY
jgi:oligosaccharide repeat unit polymerase